MIKYICERCGNESHYYSAKIDDETYWNDETTMIFPLVEKHLCHSCYTEFRKWLKRHKEEMKIG